MEIPGEFTGKQTHTYIDNTREGVVIDYEGKPGYYYELSGVHLSASPYKLSMMREFIEYLGQIRFIKGSAYE